MQTLPLVHGPVSLPDKYRRAKIAASSATFSSITLLLIALLWSRGIYPRSFPSCIRSAHVCGHQLLGIYERLYELGLTSSRHQFALEWCGRGKDFLRDRGRR